MMLRLDLRNLKITLGILLLFLFSLPSYSCGSRGLDQFLFSCRDYSGNLCDPMPEGALCVGGGNNYALGTGCGCCKKGSAAGSDGQLYCNR